MNTRPCPNCKEPNRVNSIKCYLCGTPLDGNPPQQRNNLLIGVVGVALVLVVIAVAVPSMLNRAPSPSVRTEAKPALQATTSTAGNPSGPATNSNPPTPKVDVDTSATVEVLDALDALNSATKVGLDCPTYRSRYTEVQIKVDAYFAKHGQDTPVNRKIKEATAVYDTALIGWQSYVDGKLGLYSGDTDDKKLMDMYLTSYPELRAAEIDTDYGWPSKPCKLLPFQAIIQSQWAHAGDLLRDARGLLSSPGSDTVQR